MNVNEYQELASRTAKILPFEQDLIHATLGLSSESGEFATSVKAHIVYGKPLDRVNCEEELGDIMWFVARACSALGISMTDVCQGNIGKLALRYPNAYSDHAAIIRADKQ